MGRFPESLAIPPEVGRLARQLEDAGYETWCVGGAIRDNLLGLPNKDFDLATAAPPERVREIFGRRRTIPLGVQHGTVAVLDTTGTTHEVTTFRRDIRTDGRHAAVEFGVSIDEDLARRDFTINAIAYHPGTHEWRDPFEGSDDLQRRVVRAVGDPDRRFREDYLRILRALRFAARFAFTLDPATEAAGRRAVGGLNNLSAERVREEWIRGLGGAQRPSEFIASWQEMGALAIWLPEVARGIEALPQWREVVNRLPSDDPVLMTSALASDPAAALRRLRSANRDIERARRISEYRDDLPDPRDAATVRRWLARVGAAAGDLITLGEAWGHAGALREAAETQWRAGVPLSVGELAVNGKDLLAAGVPEGPEMRPILDRLLTLVLDDPSLNRRDVLLARVADGHDLSGAGE